MVTGINGQHGGPSAAVVPAWCKWGFTAFMVVLLPVYWVNYVFGPSRSQAQHWMAPGLYLAVWMFFLLVVFHLPAHLALSKWFPKKAAERQPSRSSSEAAPSEFVRS
jgi:fatty acid desaturase